MLDDDVEGVAALTQVLTKGELPCVDELDGDVEEAAAAVLLSDRRHE